MKKQKENLINYNIQTLMLQYFFFNLLEDNKDKDNDYVCRKLTEQAIGFALFVLDEAKKSDIEKVIKHYKIINQLNKKI